MTTDFLYVFGDSHSLIYRNRYTRHPYDSALLGLKVFHLGPALAYNLLNDESNAPGKWGQQILDIIRAAKASNEKPFTIILCFGEIDIRTQILKRALQYHKPVSAVVANVVQRLYKFSVHLNIESRIPVIIQDPVPSMSDRFGSYNPEFPTVGTELERNRVTEIFSLELRKLVVDAEFEGLGIYSFGAGHEFMKRYETCSEFYDDGCHLNFRGLDKLVDNLVKIKGYPFCGKLASLFSASRSFSDSLHLREISSCVRIVASSYLCAPFTLVQTSNRGYCFHTDEDLQPYVLIDIGYAALVSHLSIVNRIDEHPERAKSLKVEVGISVDRLQCVYESICV